jgi:MFS transporter, DHA1 family, tetracycline resistance protein
MAGQLHPVDYDRAKLTPCQMKVLLRTLPYSMSEAAPDTNFNKTAEAAPNQSGNHPTSGSLLVLFLVVFIDLLGFGMVLPLLPNYAKQFDSNMSGWMIGLLMSIFSAMQFLFAPFWGMLSDRIGRRPVLMVGLLGSVVSYALFAYASIEQSLVLLFISRIGAGIAGATIPTAQAYIADSTSLKGRTHGMALIGAAFGLGFTFGPLFGYFAVQNENDAPGPGPGYAAAILSAVALVLAYFYLRESLSKESRAENLSERRRWWDGSSWRIALATPSMGLLFISTFVCVFAFANFEATLSLLLKGSSNGRTVDTGFGFTYRQVLLTFTFIGFSLLLVQGGLVRRLSNRVRETSLTTIGTMSQVIGFGGMLAAIRLESVWLLFTSLFFVVSGFSFITPALNSLISRRSDPAQQGRILGVSQSVNSLARILGPLVGNILLVRHLSAPYMVALALIVVGGGLVLVAGRQGKDFPASG